jgi:serine/threonine-protein kinase
MLRSVVLLTSALAIAGCSGGVQQTPSGSSSLQAHARHFVESVRAVERFGIDPEAYAARMAARGPGLAPAAKGATLFVSDLDAGLIRLYPAKGKSPQQSGSITDGVNAPINVAADASGTLYVANNGNSTVTEYPLGATSPSVTLSTSIVYPNGIAVDSKDTLYVTSGSTVGDTYVLVFPKGATSPSAQIGNFGLAIGLAVDKNDDLFVCDAHDDDVYEIKSGTSKAVNLGLSGLEDPTGAAVDPAGDLYVSDEAVGHFAVNAFHPGKASPFLTITSGLDGPYDLAFDAKSTLFVGNSEIDPGNVTEYAKGKTTPSTSFTNGIENPAGLAVYPPVKF